MDRKDEKAAYLIALPAILLAIVLKIIPLLGAFKLPFIDYNPAMGIGGSPYVGFRNFSNLFSTYYFRRLVSNTLILKFGFILISGILAFILGLSLSYIAKKWLRNAFIVLFSIPFFIPTSVFSYILLEVVSIRWFADPERFRITYIIIEAARASGILSIIVLSFIMTKKRDKSTNAVMATKAVSIFLLVQLSSLMTIDFEMLNEFLNPLVYNVADTIDTYMYRTGILDGEVNQVAPMWFIRYITQLLITVGVYYTIKNTYIEDYISEEEHRDLSKQAKPDNRLYPKILGLLICCVYVVILCMPIISFFKTGGELATDLGSEKFKNVDIFSIFFKYLSVTLLAVILNMIITMLLSYPLTTAYSGGQRVYEILLLILLVSGQDGIHEYIYYRSLGMVGTIYPYILNGFFSIMNVIVLAGIYNSEYSFSGLNEYFIRLYRPAIALSGLQFITIWNSYYPAQALYMHNLEMYSPIVLFQTMVASVAGELSRPLLIMGLLVSLPPIIVGTLLCIFADRRIFMSRIRD